MQIEKTKIEEKKKLEEQDVIRLRKEKDICESQILSLKEELELVKKTYEVNRLQLETKADATKHKLEKKILELDGLLTDSRKKVKELSDFSESKFLRWKRKEHEYRHFIDSQFVSLQVCGKLRSSLMHLFIFFTLFENDVRPPFFLRNFFRSFPTTTPFHISNYHLRTYNTQFILLFTFFNESLPAVNHHISD